MPKTGLVSIIVTLICVAASLCFAQSYLSSSPTAAPKNPQANVSADDFKNQVQSIDTKTQTDLKNQVDNILKQSPKKTPPPPPPSPIINKQPTETTPDQAIENTPPETPTETTPKDETTTESTSPAQPIAPTQPQIFPGFSNPKPSGTGNSKTPKNTGTGSPSGGGWNIKY